MSSASSSSASSTTFARALRSPPNVVTLSRIGLIALAVLLFTAGHPHLALLTGVLAGATDYLDGWLARRTGRVTRLGEILDQFCDVALELVLLVMASTFAGGLPPLLLVPYVLREMWVAGIRRYAAEKRVNIPSRFSGKLKSAFLGWSAVPLFLGASTAASSPWASRLVALGRFGVAVGLVLSVVSGVQYTRDFIRVYED